MDNKIKCAVIGLGRIGSTLEDDKYREKPASHAGVIADNPDCELVAGCDSDDKKGREFSSRWKCNTIFNDCNKMLDNIDVDILHIAAPSEKHKQILECGINHHVPVIICEKPLAETLVDAKAMVKMSESSNSVCMINHERRYQRDYVHVKKIIRKQVYGSLFSVVAKLYMGKKRNPVKMLWDDGTHMIDIIRFLTGSGLELINTAAHPESYQVLFNAGDTRCLFDIGRGRNYITFELDLSFESGRIRIGNGIYEEYISRPSPYYEKMRSLQLRQDVQFSKSGYFSNMMKDAVRLFRNPEEHPVSDIHDGLKSVEFMDKIVSNLKW